MAEFFGYEIKKNKKIRDEEPLASFQAPLEDDGAITVTEGGYGLNAFGDISSTTQSDIDLITRYRNMAGTEDVEAAVDEIVNQMVANDPEEDPVKIILDDIKVSDIIKKKIEDEFETVLSLLNFKFNAYDIARKWYVDSRLVYDVITDPKNLNKGILEVRQIDPLKIRKVRVIEKKRVENSTVQLPVVKEEYYMFNESGFGKQKSFVAGPDDVQGIKIPKDRIAYITSGLLAPKGDQVIGYLNKAIRPLNMLRTMEDSAIIYRITRAIDRRVFYIDVGTMPKAKAEQYMRDMMAKFRNKIAYDPTTGEIKDQRKYMTMIEDFWLPRRGERGTQIDTLPAGQGFNNLDEITYFLKKLYKSLNVPVDRLDSESMNNLGRASEITREEIKFNKFIERLRLKFQSLFTEILGKQLILKNIATNDDWKDWKNKIDYRFANDNYYSELKDIEIMQERMSLLDDMSQYAGRFFSNVQLRKSVLRQTVNEIEEIDKEIAEELKDPQYNPPLPEEQANNSNQ